MDLNYLFHRHQVSLMRSMVATSAEARAAHSGLARGYGLRIAMLRDRMGALGVRFARVS